MGISYSSNSIMWFGLSDVEFNDIYKWIDNSSLNYTNWFPGSPSHIYLDEPENYGSIHTEYGKWNDRTGLDELPFVCES